MEQMEHLSLSWDDHQKNICNGLCQLQQRGEFVDMTLAADGHHVKVHQMILSLVSPYIKDLISTAKCPHPVIFLNNISYTTLCAILEYIYKGEVLVPKHQLQEIIAAGRALHIKGLKEMDENTAESGLSKTATPSPPRTKNISERLRLLKEKKKPTPNKGGIKTEPAPICRIYLDADTGDSTRDETDYCMEIQDDSNEADDNTRDSMDDGTANNEHPLKGRELSAEDTKKILLNSNVQYTVSNQGGLQIMYNRYLYQLRYISKGSKGNRKITWRCIDYNKTKCTAYIFTNDDDEVVDRTFKHNHTFHDKNILRKHRICRLYSRFQDAKLKTERIKKNLADRIKGSVLP